jgi:hypothetical protein
MISLSKYQIGPNTTKPGTQIISRNIQFETWFEVKAQGRKVSEQLQHFKA